MGGFSITYMTFSDAWEKEACLKTWGWYFLGEEIVDFAYLSISC